MVHQIPCRAAMNSVEWNPKYNLHANAGDDKNKYQADEGVSEYLALRMHKIMWNGSYKRLEFFTVKKNWIYGNMFQFFIFVGGKILAMEGEITSPAYDHPSTR
ncbi:hypothetical protein Q3G72_012393 [Acer saccharum]|nr:hypothetical protein Q3G72_012393 [Acer saccharum]